MNAPETKIALTLFTLRDYCQTEKDLDATLKTLRNMGYRAIQVSAVPLHPQAVRDIADKHGLYICAAHENLPDLRNRFDQVVEKLKTWDCNFTALGHPGDAFSVDPQKAGKLIAELNDYGKTFAEQGIRFAYHNHHTDFARVGDSTFMECLVNETDPDSFFLEMDLHWVQRGGQSPVDWIQMVAGRMPVCHFKDYAIVGADPIFCEVGEGNLNWKAIIQACEQTDVRWYVVEQDAPVDGRSIFESVEISFRNLKNMGVI